MRTMMKRFSAGMLALVLVLSLTLTGLPVRTQAASTTYNTGTRHDYNAVLSDQALSYYTGNNTWDKLSALQGGTEDCLDMDNPMFEALNNLMTSTMTNSVSYSSLPDYWKYTDASGGSSGTIWFYLDSTTSATMSREHVWPKSHASFHEKDGGADLHHLRPSVSNINSSRGNLIMGNVRGTSGAKTYSYNGTDVLYRTSTLCEVNDNIKGDVARIFLYVWCRWEEPNLFKNTPNPVTGPNDSANDGGKVIESLDTLLEWCEIDPVDTWEMSRNDKVQDVQGNRNVFIDYPEFAWLIFGRDVPSGYNTPSDNGGSASGGSGSTSCTHSWSAATCTEPKTCSKCGETDGEALGHSWVNATCLSPKTCSVCKATEGTTANHADNNNDDTCDVCGANLGTSTPPVGTVGSYVLITSANQFTTGQYVMIADKGYGPGVYDNGWLTAVQPTVDGNVVTDAMGGIWTLTVIGSSVTLTDANGVTVAPKSGNNNGIISGSYDWAWTMADDGTVRFKGTGSDTTTLASNTTSSNQFRAYKNTTVSSGNYPCNFKLYKLVEAVHEHSYESAVTTAPTCTATGVTTYTCSCGNSYTEVIAVLGHSYNAAVTAPTCVDAGFTTYTCANCGNSYKTDETAATGHTAGDALVENEKAPTCVAAGSYESAIYCTICDAEISRETVEVPATGEHTYDNDSDADCNVCGETREVGPIADSALKFMQAPSLSFQDYIGMQVLMTKKLANNYDKVYVEAVQVTPEGEVTTTLEPITYLTNYYVFDQQIMAWSMTEVVTLTLYAEKDGKTYVGQTYTQSVESLALAMMQKYSTNTTICRMLVDMLNYGAAVQTQFSHNAENLPNTQLGDFAAMGSTNIPVCDADHNDVALDGLTRVNHSVSMQAKVEIQIAIKNAVINAVTATIGETELTPVLDTTSISGYTVIRVPIGATQMRERVCIYLEGYTYALPDMPSSFEVSCDLCVEAYAMDAITGSQKNVVIAMMRYGDSVTAYANK